AARTRWQEMSEQIREFSPRRVSMTDPESRDQLSSHSNGTEVLADPADLVEADDVDVVVAAITGAAGLEPGLRALEAGKTVALANKEALVMAGPIMLEAARKNDCSLLPIDSEHNAIFQAMQSGGRHEVKRIILTASGGPFANHSKEKLRDVTVEEALNHPTWDMGQKITIDSATMFNKALEILEARWLFGLRPDQIDVVVHPQSIVHSIVEYQDGSMIAQMGVPDMRTPIQYALTFPHRYPGRAKSLNLAEAGSLTFREPDVEKFPSLSLGLRAAEVGGTMGAVLNGANEVAVDLFLKRKISFVDIFTLVESVMDRHEPVADPNLDHVLQADRWARTEAGCWTS
ncbi:MAG: 1-deoxy-D-xylulose-5-phosphate reductoisomerase, partial [Planctomycetota bacterium]|nr:1-deoxy-D-xylulose-5-phosphate reductoisomerase [Planctomycetota bacterium]